ncbi:hypothetical protein C725_1136 [Pacificimonas flava]|uniref:Uncharacterized protein n=1 Tax=Pacificimonas flava TaxID=1234595 RepID=M2SCZ4_9SPHN|nr:hypothetical protein C725_1136 [Pacificimonas flava]
MQGICHDANALVFRSRPIWTDLQCKKPRLAETYRAPAE